MVWIIDAAVVLVTMLFWVVFYNRMVPLKINSIKFTGKDQIQTIEPISKDPSIFEASEKMNTRKISMSTSLPVLPREIPQVKKQKLRPVKSLYVPDVY